MQRREYVRDICEYLVDSYEALPIPKKGQQPKRLIVLVNVIQKAFNSPYQSRTIAQTICRELHTVEDNPCNHIERDHLHMTPIPRYKESAKIVLISNILADLADLTEGDNSHIILDEPYIVKNFGKPLDKKVLFVPPQYQISGRSLGGLTKHHDRIFPWEWKAQNE